VFSSNHLEIELNWTDPDNISRDLFWVTPRSGML